MSYRSLQLQREFEKETGTEVIQSYGDGCPCYIEYHSHLYVQWLHRKIQDLEQRLEAGRNGTAVMWRSVNKELPKIGQQVLLAPDGVGSNLRIGRLQRNNSWYFMGTQPMNIITHWMPLPKLPKAT